MESPAKIIMKHVWRFQQVGGIISVILMCLNLTIPIYAYSGWRIENLLGIPHNLDWLIVLIIFGFVFSIAFISGFIYDKVFQLWKHKEVVGAERNPYNKGRITPNELIRWQYTIIPLLQKNDLVFLIFLSVY